MPPYIALIRGINVGGRNMLPMPALRAAHESLGFENVKTHLQSGNVVFTAKKSDPVKLAKQIEKALPIDVRVVVRTPDDLRAAIDANPFPQQAKAQPSALVVVFLEREPDAAAAKAFGALNVGPELKHLNGRDLYVFYGAGMGRSKLTNALIEKKLGVAGTARNWNTVTKLLEMASALER